MTFRPTTAPISFAVAISKERRSGSARKRSHTTKSNAAMANCVHRKNRGVSVVLSTHLFLGGTHRQSRASPVDTPHAYSRHYHLQSDTHVNTAQSHPEESYIPPRPRQGRKGRRPSVILTVSCLLQRYCGLCTYDERLGRWLFRFRLHYYST